MAFRSRRTASCFDVIRVDEAEVAVAMIHGRHHRTVAAGLALEQRGSLLQ